MASKANCITLDRVQLVAKLDERIKAFDKKVEEMEAEAEKYEKDKEKYNKELNTYDIGLFELAEKQGIIKVSQEFNVGPKGAVKFRGQITLSAAVIKKELGARPIAPTIPKGYDRYGMRDMR